MDCCNTFGKVCLMKHRFYSDKSYSALISLLYKLFVVSYFSEIRIEPTKMY